MVVSYRNKVSLPTFGFEDGSQESKHSRPHLEIIRPRDEYRNIYIYIWVLAASDRGLVEGITIILSLI